MPRANPVFLIAAALLVLCSFPDRSRANVQEIFGLSPRAAGMGNAFSAIANDFSACYYNPAGLAQADHHQMTLGYLFCQPRLKQYLYRDTRVPNAEEQVNYRGVVFGTLLHLSRIFNTRGHNLVLGVAATVGDNFKAAWRFHDWNPEVPRFIRYGDSMNRAHIYSGLGLEVFRETLYVGVGINYWQDQAVPSVKIKMDLATRKVLEREIDLDADAEISPIVGILYKPSTWLSLAFTYRDQWSQEAPTNITDTIAIGPGTLPVQIRLLGRDYYQPWNLTFGLALRPHPRLLLSVDVIYYHWSGFDLPMWEGKYPEWDDTVVPRFGLECRVWKGLRLRGGYYYEGSPVPDQMDVPSNHLDFNKHVFSSGLGYSFSELPFVGELPLKYPISLDAFFQWQMMEDRTQIKSKSTGQDHWWIEGYQIAVGLGITTGF